MDLSELERLTELVQKANIRELTLRQGDSRLTIRKPLPEKEETGTALVPYEGDYSEETDFASAVYEAEEAETADQPVLVTSPSVGIFRHIKPIVGLNAHVKAGQIMGLIEALKLTNEVVAPSAGIVQDLLIEDGMPVEYGQAIFAMKASE